jgi:membrane protease YdiL (CAAX protease family)
MAAQAAPTAPTPSREASPPDVPATDAAAPVARRKRFARWRPRTALAVVILGLIGSQLIALALVLAAGGSDGLDWVAASGLVVADLFLVGVVVAFARRGAEKLGAATFGIRRTAFWAALGWMVLAYFAVSVFNVIWLLIVGTGSAPVDEGGSGSPSLAAVLFVIVGVAITAPIVEEIVFRGYLFPALARWRGPWIGALLGAAVFGAAHCLVYPPQLLPLMAVFGFAACMLFWFTGSLLPCIALHAMNNALVTGIDLGWSWQVPLLMLGCMAAALLIMAPFARERAPQLA